MGQELAYIITLIHTIVAERLLLLVPLSNTVMVTAFLAHEESLVYISWCLVGLRRISSTPIGNRTYTLGVNELLGCVDRH